MRFFPIICIHLFPLFIHEVRSDNNSSEHRNIINAVTEALSILRPYQVTVFLHKCVNYDESNQINSLIRTLSIKQPVLIVETLNLQDHQKYIRQPHPLLDNPRYTTMFLSIFHLSLNCSDGDKFMQMKFKRDLEFVTNLSPRLRAHFLVVLKVQRRISENVLKSLLNFAWRKKFLNLGVLQSAARKDACDANLISHTYNPFFDDYSTNCYSSYFDLFPNKLRDLNGYPLRFSLLRRPSAVDFDRDPDGNPININGSDYGNMVILSQTMNFTMEMFTPNIYSYGELLDNRTSLLDLVANGNIEFSGNQIYLHHAFKNHYSRLCEQSIGTWHDDFIALVPVYPAPTWDILRFKAISVMVRILFHVSVMYLVAKILRFDLRHWLPHYVLQTLLGSPTPKPPVRSLERIVYVGLFLVSQIYSTNLYAELTDKHLNGVDMGPFMRMEDLYDREDIVALTHFNYYNMTFNEVENDSRLNAEFIKHMKSKVRFVDKLMECPELVLKSRNKICLMDRTIAETSIRVNTRGKCPKMKILTPKLWSAPKGYILSESSPYTPEFNRIMQLNMEGGLWRRWYIFYRDKPRGFLSEEDVKDHLLKIKLVVVWSIGCTISFVAFVSELIVKYCQNDISVFD